MTLAESNMDNSTTTGATVMTTDSLANFVEGTWQHRVYKAEMEIKRLQGELTARPTVTKYENKYMNDDDLNEARGDAEDAQSKISDLLDELRTLESDIEDAINTIDEVLEQGNNASEAVERIEEIKNQVEYVDI